MAFASNRAVNLLNAHYGLRFIAIVGGGAFFVPHMLKAGLSPSVVLASFAAVLAGRFLIRPLIVPIAERIGLRALVAIGTLLCAAQFPLVAAIEGLGAPLIAFVAFAAVGDMIYWTAFHAYFASLGDDEQRGHQLGVREASVALVGTLSPLITAWLLTTAGAHTAFGINAAVTVIAALPLLFAPDVQITRLPKTTQTATPASLLMFAADGWIGGTASIIWSLALFVTVGQNYATFGGVLSIAALAGAAGALLLGRTIDRRGGGAMVPLAIGALALSLLIKAFAIGDAQLAFLANVLGALSACLYQPTLMTAIYARAKQSRCTLRFHVATEGAWDIGAGSVLLLTAALLLFDVPLGYGIALGLLGAGALAILLRRYYAVADANKAVGAG